MRDELNTALKPFSQHDACHSCGKRTDGLMICIYSDGEITKLCPDCIKDSGFCLRCGHYSAGMSDFYFSEMEGYCGECVDEIKAEAGELEDDEDWNDEF